MTKKQVVFIGGVNGCGKTHLTEALSKRAGYIIGKQKRALIKVGKRRGIPWEKIPHHYEELIEESIDELVDNFSKSNSSVMLIDCHYAFKKQRAITVNIENRVIEIEEPFIQAIDDRLIARMKKKFRIRFVFLQVDPRIALERVRTRLKNVSDEMATVKSIAEYQRAEQEFFEQILRKFNIPKSDFAVFSNNGTLEGVCRFLMDFIST
jgi:cytidylate kinase